MTYRLKILILLCLGGAVMACLAGCRISRNFYVVADDELYRSSQLSKSELEEVINKYKIKTIINLRGERNSEQWYRDEKAVTAANHVKLVDLEYSVESIPRKSELRKLIETYDKGEKPFLVHCKSGADRTGEAVAVYAVDHLGETPQQALQHLSLKYLHFSWFTPAKDYFVEIYKGRQWALEEYDPCQSQYRFRDEPHCTYLREQESRQTASEKSK